MRTALNASMAEPDDAALMARIAEGDEAAFRLFATRHVGRMLRVAQSILGSAAEADEVSQEALLRVWRHAARWDASRAQLGTWIHTIVVRLCVDRLRLRRHEPIDAAMEVPDPAPGALESLSSRDEQRQLRAAMATLPRRQRAALVLFYQEELAGTEAARTLGLSLSAFWSLLQRARRTVQQQMQRATGSDERM